MREKKQKYIYTHRKNVDKHFHLNDIHWTILFVNNMFYKHHLKDSFGLTNFMVDPERNATDIDTVFVLQFSLSVYSHVTHKFTSWLGMPMFT